VTCSRGERNPVDGNQVAVANSQMLDLDGSHIVRP
jgi:hypothetical protein